MKNRFGLATLFALAAALRGLASGPVFPLPQELTAAAEDFVVDDSVRILLLPTASAEDQLDARELTAELSDRHGVALRVERAAALPSSGRFIVIGTVANPLVRALGARLGLTVDDKHPGPEGYALHVDQNLVLVAGSDAAGAFYGMQSLRQLVSGSEKSAVIRGVDIRDWPHKPFRAIRLYLPGRDHIAFFKRFIRDFMALYKYNHLMLECNAAMRLDRHPELNAGWIEFARNLTATRRDRPAGPRGEYVDSTHYDTGDGAVLEKSEVADIVAWAREYHIDVTPELPSLTHSYYLLTRHRELAEMPDEEWPDAYCPSNPKSYELLFDVLDEYIDVIKPSTVHVGHDEWRILLPTRCPLCRGKDPRELFAADLRKIHDHLAQRGVGMAIWGDQLIENKRGKIMTELTARDGHKYYWPGGLTALQVRELVPRDILIANWFWREGKEGEGEMNEIDVENWGFRQYFGNFTPDIPGWERRSARQSVIGGAPSAWVATTDFNFGKDLLYDFLGSANLLWSRHWPAAPELEASVQAMMPEVRTRLGGSLPPSAAGEDSQALKIPSLRHEPSQVGSKRSTVKAGPVTFEIAGPTAVVRTALGEVSAAIPIGEDASSVVFLQACEKPAHNEPAYQYVFNFDDTADLLGCYEIAYEDGLVASVPVRYGVNVLEQTWPKTSAPHAYCYQADPVVCGPDTTFFAFEWPNPRLGKVIESIRFRASADFRTGAGTVLENNALLLKAISIVKQRPAAKGDDQRSRD